MWIWICIALPAVVALAIVHSCMVLSGNISRQEEKKAWEVANEEQTVSQ